MTAWYGKAIFYHMYPLGDDPEHRLPIPILSPMGQRMAPGTFPPIPAWTN